ncbi:MAG: ornithine decarboxylase, partial [Microbacteriaceae bacterium]
MLDDQTNLVRSIGQSSEGVITVPTDEEQWLGPYSGMPSSPWRARSDAWEYTRYFVKLLALGGADVSDQTTITELFRSLRALETIEFYWAGIGQRQVREIREQIEHGQFSLALDHVRSAMQGMKGYINSDFEDHDLPPLSEEDAPQHGDPSRKKFEVLVIDQMSENDKEIYEQEVRSLRTPGDAFIYDVVIVPSAEDAVAAVLTNPNILAVIMRPGFSDHTKQPLSRDLKETIEYVQSQVSDDPLAQSSDLGSVQRVLTLANTLKRVRPELDLYLVAGAHIEDLAGQLTRRFRRVFRREDQLELHLSLLR